MFKKIEKGFTIIELLAVVVIIGVIMVLIRPTIQNMIENARYRATQQSIKGYIREAELKSTTSNISVNGIKIGPTKFVFETGADEEDLAKIKINGKYPDYIYMEYNKEGEVIYGRFCLNNYSLLYENNEVTDAEENYCADEYTETPIVSIDNVSVKTSSAIVTFSVSNNYPITSTTCDYGETPLFGNTGSITNKACRIDKLEHNRIYYYRVCATNTKGRKGCRTDYLLTSNMNHPTIEYINTPGVEQNGYLKTQVLKVTYDRTNVENPEYYIKSTLKATTNNNVVSRCGMDTLPKNCTNQTTKEILPDNWYKVSGNINVTYDNNSVNQGSLTALLSDGVDYSASTTAIVSRIDNELPTIALKDVQATSNTLRINYTLSDSKSGIKSYTCKWGTSNNNYNNTVASANVTESSCIITGLEVRKPYYYQICTTDNVNNNYCYTGSAETASIIAPQITITKTPNEDINGYLGKAIIKVFYSSVNVTNPEYYIRSSRVGIVPAGSITSSCGTSTMPGTCTNSTVTTLTPDTWYRVNRNIDITYDSDSTEEGRVTAYLSDGSQYSGAASINIPKIDKTNPTITLGNKVIKTNSITLNYALNDSKTGIRDYTCKYGTSSNNYNISGASITSTSCLLNNLKENTTYYYQICTIDGVGNGPVCITGSDTTTSIINPTITYTNIPAGITYVAPNSGDTHKGILYFDPSNLNAKCDEDSTIDASSTTGCKKFYIYDDEGSTYKMIMDRNLGASVQWISQEDFIAAGGTAEEYGTAGNNRFGPITANNAVVNRTINWIGNPRMITADEVAHIVGADREDTIKWDSSKSYGNYDLNTQSSWYYFDGGRSSNPTDYSETTGWRTKLADSQGSSHFAWLYDYTESCTSYGCNTSGSPNGYWTSTKISDNPNKAWYPRYDGTIERYRTVSDTNIGIRPVLEIPKTLVTRNNYYKEQTANVTFISTNVENPIYYIKSTREGTTNINVLQSCGTETLPQNCVSSSVKNIVANTWYKVSGNINVTYNTDSNKEDTLYALTYDGVNYGGGVGNTISKIDREVPTVRITNTTTTTNSAVIYYALDDTKSGIGTYTCKYGTTSGTYDNIASEVAMDHCTISKLNNNTTYYYQVCVTDASNNGPSCKEGNFSTKDFSNINISYTNTPSTIKNGYLKEQTLNINYNADNINTPNYYIKTTKKGIVSSATIAKCGNGTVPGTCTSTEVTAVDEDMWYKVSSDISVTYKEQSTYIGTVYMDPSDLTATCNNASTIDVSDATGNTGCKKFYIYNDDGNNYIMIMDRNLGGNVAWVSKTDYVNAGGSESSYGDNGNNSLGPITVTNALTSKTAGWVGNPRLITATEIADIVGADREDTIKWNIDKTFSNEPNVNIDTQIGRFYFDGGRNGNLTSYAGWYTKYATSQGMSNYAWLYDYTINCTSNGCNIVSSNSTYGYWTSDYLHGNSTNAWVWLITNAGVLSVYYPTNSSYGIRPVLTIPKGTFTSSSFGGTIKLVEGIEGTLYASLYDGYNYSRSTSGIISKIDATNPNISITPSSTTNSITLDYTLTDNHSGVGNVTCMYSATNGTYNIEANSVDSTKCYISGLQNNKNYYIQLCVDDLVGNTTCSNQSITTKEFTKPIITLVNTPTTAIGGYLRSQVAEVVYNNTNISNPTYYLKTTRAAVASTSTIAACGNGETPNISNCTDYTSTTLSKDTWYKVTNTVNVTYNSDATTEATIYAYTYDGINLSGSEQKTISKIEASTPVAPIITGGSNDWNTSNTTISIQAPGTAISGVKNYEYYVSNNEATPESTVTPTGTTSNSYTVSNGGVSYVYYRTLSNAGNRSAWTNYQKVSVDTTAPTTPTITYNSGSNINLWQNNIDIKLSSSDTLPGSGVSHYEVDTNNDGNSDITTTESYIPTDGFNSNNAKFRAVDFASNKSGWTTSINVLMDTTAPILTNKAVTSLTYQNVTVELTIIDNASGVPNTPETYNNHKAGAYCVVSTSMGNYENNEWINATLTNDKYVCNIDPALFKHYETNYVVQVYVYDRAGNGGMLDQLNIFVPAKDYKATASCSNGGIYQNGSCYFENNNNVCGCSEYNQTCGEYNQVCTEYNQVCGEWNTECSEYNYSCSVNAGEGYTCDTCTSSNMNEEVYCRKHTDNGFTYTTNTCSCTATSCKTYTNTTCKTYVNGTCKTYTNTTCKKYVDNLSSCKTAKSCYEEAYIVYSCPLGGEVVGDMCVRDTDTYTVNFQANGGTISNGIYTKKAAVGYKYGYLPTPTREGYRFVGWYQGIVISVKERPPVIMNNGDDNYRNLAIPVTPGTTYKLSIENVEITEGIATQFSTIIYDFNTKRSYELTNHNIGRNIEYTFTVPNSFDSTHLYELRIYNGIRGQTYGIGIKFTNLLLSSFESTSYTKDTISLIAENHHLVAKWEPETYTITFDPNGGTVSQTSKEVTYGSTYGDLPTPTREGYTFKGWNGKNLFDWDFVYSTGRYIRGDGSTVSHDSYTIYKQFVKPNTTYTITHSNEPNNPGYVIYDSSGTRVAGSDYFMKRTVTFTTPSNASYILFAVVTDESYERYDKDYFQLEEGDTATLYEPYYIKSDTTVVQPSAHTLTAIWEPNTYTVTYDSNGGSEINTSKQVTYGEAYGELPTPVKDGYVFKGWNGKNILNLDVSESKPSDTTQANSTKRTFIPNTYIKGIAYNNYYRLANVYSLNIDNNKIVLDAASGYGVGFPLLSEANKTYTLSYDVNYNGTNDVYTSILFYKSDGTNISNSTKASSTSEHVIKSFTTPADTYYMVVTFTVNNARSIATFSNIQLEEGNTATPYVPYLITPSTNVSTNANHTLKAIYTSYCDKEGISTLKECLIRNDSKDTYANAINTINSRTPNFDETVKDVSKSGLFVSDDDYTTNDQTKTYYYRGVVNNNWVKFGDYLWRIIRINGDGSIRMMYQGLASDATHMTSNANINKTTYSYGVYETYTKNTTDLYDSSKTVATTYKNGRFGNTYVGYMYNPNRIFMTYPNKEVSTSYKLSSFPTFTNTNTTTEYYFFDSFDPSNCDSSTSDDTGACTLKCRKKGVDGDSGVNCVKSTWPDLASAHTSTTGDGTTSTQYLYTSPYKYTCWGYSSAKEVNNADGTTSVYISCPIVFEILGTLKDEPTQAKVKYHGLFSSDAETSNQNIKDSNAKVQVENWYATNILGKTDSNNVLLENYLQDSIFCNERVNTDLNAEWPLNKSDNFYYTYRRVANQRKPTFKCLNADGTFNTNDSFTLKTSGTDSTVTASGKGNNMLKYPVGLITWDETAFVGGRYGGSYTNDAYWLYTGAHYWTMSPSLFYANNGNANVSYVNSAGFLIGNNTAATLGLRPVINLKPGVTYVSGAGTETDPYIVGLPDNLFYVNAGNYSGLNVSWDKNNSILTLDGKSSSTNKLLNLYNYMYPSLKNGDEYELTIQFISGSYIRDGGATIAAEIYKADGSNVTGRKYVDIGISTNANISRTLTISSTDVSQGAMFGYHLYFANGINTWTFNNYKVRVTFKKIT